MLPTRPPLLIVAVIAGCSSISSTMLNRFDNDQYAGNSNGQTTCHNEARPFKGVPITVRVPTHLDVAIKETLLIAKDDNNRLYQMTSSKRHIFVEARLVETEKVFTVDPQRPAAGTLKYSLSFGNKGKAADDPDNSQYFQSIAYRIQDDTVREVNKSISTLLPLLGGQPVRGRRTAGDSISRIADEVVRVIAWKRFDVDAPDFESQVECFVEHNLNCCDSCQFETAPVAE